MAIYNEYTILSVISNLLKSSDKIGDKDQIIVDAESTYNLVDENNVDTPAFILELDDTIITKASIKGSLLYGKMSISGTGMLLRNNRPFTDYKPLIVAFKHRIEDAFDSIDKAKITIVKTKWSDFLLPSSLKATGFVMTIEVEVHSFNYSI